MSDETKKEVTEAVAGSEKEATTETETKNETAPAKETIAKTDVKADDVAVADATDVDETVEVPEKFAKLVEQLEQLSVLELNELVKVLEKRFGVSASAVAVAAPAAATDTSEEQTEFTVELTEAGAQKIAVIKVVKEAAGLGLKEAKDLVEGAPNDVKTGLKKEDAEALKTKLEEAGAKVTLK